MTDGPPPAFLSSKCLQIGVGVGGGGGLPRLCDQVISSSISPRTCLLHPQRERSKRLVRTHLDCSKINRHMIEVDGAEAEGKEKEEGRNKSGQKQQNQSK